MDDDALRVELERHHAKCFGWSLNCCRGDSEEAEDVLQTVYLKILEGRARFGGQSSFKTWLLALIRNTAVDAWRRRRQYPVAFDEGEPPEAEAPEVGPDELADRQQTRTALGKVLASLPARQQQVLRLVFYHDLSLAQAAEVIGISLGSARTHYERGKEQLRRRLAGNREKSEIRSSKSENHLKKFQIGQAQGGCP